MPTRPLLLRYEQDLDIFADLWHRVGVVCFIIATLAFPVVASEYWLGISLDAMIAVVGSVALMILTGYAGQVSLGHAAFMGVGAYTTAILGSFYGVPFWLALPIAGLVATAVGLMVGPFALRLEGLYLAIVTVGLLFMVQHVIKQGVEPYFGRDSFLTSMHTWFVIDPSERLGLGSFYSDVELAGLRLTIKHKLYVLFMVLSVGVAGMAYRIEHSRTGRAMMAVRDRDTLAAVLGVNPVRIKFIAFGVSSFLAGVAGGMYAFAHPTLALDITTGEPFSLTMSVMYLAMIVLGGVGTLFGAIWGALALTVFFPLMENLGHYLPFPSHFSTEQQGGLLFFPLLCLFLVLEPLGLFGIWLRIKRYFLAWPFRY
jgi:branched-chain amino acid transport system permease protein